MIISVENACETKAEENYLLETCMILTEQLEADGIPSVHLSRYALEDVQQLLPIIAKASSKGYVVVTQNLGKLLLHGKTGQLPDVFIFLEMDHDKITRQKLGRKIDNLKHLYKLHKKPFISRNLPVKNRFDKFIGKNTIASQMRIRVKDLTNQ